MVSKVGVISGDNRSENITRALELIKNELLSKIAKKRRVIIKTNLGFINTRLANTQGEAVAAVLEFLRKHYTKKILIAEGTTIGKTKDGFSAYGYNELVNKFNVELVDLNKEKDFKEFKIYDPKLEPKILIEVSKTILKSDFIISVCPMKTHDSVVVTLGIKNVVVGAIKLKDRPKIHAGPQAINLTIAKLAKRLLPSLVVLDGFEAMEGSGPVSGDRVDFRIALAGTDALAVDAIGSCLMGFRPEDIGYLYYLSKKGLGCGDPLKIAILGNDFRKLVRRFKPHPRYQLQLDWKISNFEF